jgi:hypothetical protein
MTLMMPISRVGRGTATTGAGEKVMARDVSAAAWATSYRLRIMESLGWPGARQRHPWRGSPIFTLRNIHGSIVVDPHVDDHGGDDDDVVPHPAHE